MDPDKIPQLGLVVEEVAKVNPDLVARDEEGKSYIVRYEAVNAMLLNEFLKEHHKVQELEKQVAALTAEPQKVAALDRNSKPDILGIFRSLIIRSGSAQCICANAAKPSFATPTS